MIKTKAIKHMIRVVRPLLPHAGRRINPFGDAAPRRWGCQLHVALGALQRGYHNDACTRQIRECNVFNKAKR